MFDYQLFGCRMRIDFPVVKLLDYANSLVELLTHRNPFALVTAAHLLTQATRKNMHKRRAFKWSLTRLLYRRNWDKRSIMDLYLVIDWMMRLPVSLDQRLQQVVLEWERRNIMPYVSSMERYGRKRGHEEGLKEGRQEGRVELLVVQLCRRFGQLDPVVRLRIAAASGEELTQWAVNLLDARRLEDVFRSE